jgi:plasmid stabilization system protein ParE
MGHPDLSVHVRNATAADESAFFNEDARVRALEHQAELAAEEAALEWEQGMRDAYPEGATFPGIGRVLHAD